MKPLRRVGPALLTLGLAAAVAATGISEHDLRPVPHPASDLMEETVETEISLYRDRLRRLLERSTAAADLAEAFGELGRLYQTYLFLDAAEACYFNARLLAPGELTWSYYLAVLHQRRRALETAAPAFERVLEIDPDYLPALIRLGQVELERQNRDRAAALFQRALDGGSERAAAHAGLARVAFASGDFETAARRFRSALEIQPQADRLHYQLGMALRDLGDLDAARSHLALAGTRGETFPDPLMRQLVAESTAAHLLKAGQARRQGDLERSLAEYRKALESAPESVSVVSSLAWVLLEAGEIDESIELYRRAVELAPEHPAAHLNLGVALSRREAADGQAVRHMRKAVEIAPEYALAHLRLAQLLVQRKRHQDAEPHFARAVGLNPHDHDARLQWARSLSRIGRHETAIRELEHLSAARPDDTAVLLDLASVRRLAGDRDGARSLWSELAAVEGDSFTRALSLFNLGNLLLEDGRVRDAAEHYRRSIESEADFRDARFNLAATLLRLGEYDEAVVHFGRLSEDDPEDEGAVIGQAEALSLAGRYGQASTTLVRGLELLPTSAHLAQALARLLAACPEEGLRDAQRALQLATAALEASGSADAAETLAMALAASGRFAEAVRWQERLLAEAERAAVPADRIAFLRRNLTRYRQNLPALYRP